MKTIMICIAGFAGAMGVVASAAAGNSSLAPLTFFNLSSQYAQVMIAQASQAQQAAANVDRSVGICAMVENPTTPSRTGQNVFSPVAITRGYLNKYEHQVVAGVSNVTVLQKPAHGTLEDLGTIATDQNGNVLRDTGERKYYYRADAGYVGQDSVSLLVEMGGYKVKVTYFLHVFGHVISDDTPLTKELCPNGQYLWKISTAPDVGNVALGNSVLSWLASTDYSSILSTASGVALNLANLPSGAVGQTTGTTITLDNNAAGYN